MPEPPGGGAGGCPRSAVATVFDSPTPRGRDDVNAIDSGPDRRTIFPDHAAMIGLRSSRCIFLPRGHARGQRGHDANVFSMLHVYAYVYTSSFANTAS